MGDIVVKKSKIHGKGVFANKDFKKGEIVVKYNLKKLTKKEFESLPDKEKHFISREGKDYLLFLSPERYVNHSCNPNTNSLKECDVAVKNIKKGEEITGDYFKEAIPNLNMKCNCGSKNCKEIIK